MKKIILILCVIYSSISNAQTFFSGGIYSSTTWTVANSPYIINGNVVVFPGVTLTIEPGVEVRIEESPNPAAPYTIETRGTIDMIGDPGSLITFRANTLTQTIGTWGGFFVKNSQGGNINFNYLSVSNAINAFSYDGAVPGSIVLNNCEFKFNGSAISNGVNLVATDCYFYGNYSAVSGWSNFTFERCVFDSNSTALPVYASFFSVDSCVFSRNNQAIYFSSSAFTGIEIKNSTFSNNIVAMTNANNGNVHNCLFEYNQSGIESSIQLNVFDCTFNYNDVALVAGFGTSVTNCEINFNNKGVLLGPVSFGQPVPVVENNRICGNSLYNIENSTDLNLFLPTNCFCESDSTIIEDKIYDGYDDITRGLISYAIFDTSCTTVLKIVNKDPSITGIEETVASLINVYPNPVSDRVTINSYESGFIQVTDVNGRRVFGQNTLSGSSNVDLSSLEKGLYFIKFTGTDSRMQTIKIVKSE